MRSQLTSFLLVTNFYCVDTFSNLTYVSAPASAPDDATPTNYTFSEKGIAWPGEAKKYSSRPGYNLTDIVPPPNWIDRFPDGFNDTNVPNLHEDEHFQNWMRTAGLPTFTKLWGRNDADKLVRGRYQLTVNMSAFLFLFFCRINLTPHHRLPRKAVSWHKVSGNHHHLVDGR